MNARAAQWTLGELGARVIASLATDYPGVQNRQARDLPNARAIRWYASLGLLDRPAGWNGRVALYGPRHLMQLVAIKRLQAEGLALVDVQARLAGITDDALAALAKLPRGILEATSTDTVAAVAPRSTRRGRAFWLDEGAGPTPAVANHDVAPAPAPLQGIRTDDGVALTFPCARALDAADLAALHAALGPVADLLRARGLVLDVDDEGTR